VSTREINQARSNNPQKFVDPKTGKPFAWQLSDAELTTLPEVIKNFDNLSKGIKFRSYNPWVYNLEGINMLATILKSDIAVLRAIQIVMTFSDLERMAHGEQTCIFRPHVLTE
jgi:hypothetical protein